MNQDQARSYLLLRSLSGGSDLPRSHEIMEMLVSVLDATVDEDGNGVADSLLTFYGTLCDEEGKEITYLDCCRAEETMMASYAMGFYLAINPAIPNADLEDIRVGIDNGNSGFTWPEGLTYDMNLEEYPEELCERFGYVFGYRHGRESLQMRELAKRVDEVGLDQAIKEIT